MVEELKAIMERMGAKASEGGREEKEKKAAYLKEYGLLREPSNYEVQRIEEIKRRRRYCERCEGLEECQYKGGDRGLEAVIITSDLGGRVEGNRLYFGVKECRYLVEAEESKRQEEEGKRSGIPERQRQKNRYDLREEEREEIKELLTGGEKRIYVKGKGERVEEYLSIIGNESIKAGLKVRYENGAEVVSELRVTNPEYHEKMKEMKGVEVLIIEGLRSNQSRYNDEQIGMILNVRRRVGLRTVINGEERKGEQRGVIGEELRRYKEKELN